MLKSILSGVFHFGVGFHAIEVYPGLFQGSMISTDSDVKWIRDLEIKTVIDLEGGFDPPMGFLESYLFWPILDLPFLPDLVRLENIASFGWMAMVSNDKVLVHCRCGLNRSGLVCAKIMSLSGLKGPEILKTINEKIRGSLWNPVFREYVMGL